MMRFRLLLCSLVLCCTAVTRLHTQTETPTQTIRGFVRDKETGQFLAGAGIRIEALQRSAVSDENGAFILERVPVGRVHLRVERTGYQPYTPEDLLLLSAKVLFLEIELIPDARTLKTTEIRAAGNAFEPLNALSVVSTRSFTVDETERVAAAIADPGRVALSYPGVQKGEDDTENQIVVRGNAPIGILWRLEGIDIPNPNHFALIGASGGGLTVFSGQLLARSDFSTGGMPAEYGNALSGAFDMHFRKGNDEHREYRAKISLIGLDFATEGPIRKGQSSYLINYRYSTLGLLNQLGFNLVGERVSNAFQDLSFNLAFKNKDNRRIFTLFGIGGLSEEHYYPVEAPAERDPAIQNHWEDRVKPANMGAVGATWTFLPDPKSAFKAVAALIGSDIRRMSDTLDLSDGRFRYETQRYTDRRMALSATYRRQLSPRLSLKTGLIFQQVLFDFFKQTTPRSIEPGSSTAQALTTTRGEGNTQQAQQYAQLQWRLAERWTLLSGYHLLHLFANNSTAFDPRLSVQYQLSANQRLSAAVGSYSRTLPLMTYYTTDTLGQYVNKPLKLLQSRHYILAWHLYARNRLRLSAEAYWQQTRRVPVLSDPASTYWMLNFSDGFPDFPVESKGKGQNYGLDVAVEQRFTKGWFFMLNGSTFRSRFELPTGAVYSSRFDSRFSTSATTGKEFTLRKGRILQLGGRYLYSGGFRYTPYDPVRSAAAGRYIPLESEAYRGQMPAYRRLDLRFAWRFNRPHYSGLLSLDIQNALNQTNPRSIAYDPVNRSTYIVYGGELVPVLGFQVDF